jgi:dephospho-CoA kinase
MIVIGLTGGIATGKSEVARILQGLGAIIINADQVGHQAYTPHSETWQEVVKAFGDEILDPDGAINRRKLGAIVFSDSNRLDQLNRIMHPRMAKMVAQQIEDLRREDPSAVVVEAAILFEAGWESLCDEVWTTETPFQSAVERLKTRNGMAEEDAQKRINSQMSAQERASRSQVVVDNSGDLAQLYTLVESLWNNRVEGKVGRE